MGIVRTVLISTIDLKNKKSLCKNLSLRKFKKLKFQYFPLYFWEYSLVKIKVQFWEGRWPRIKKFRKQKLLSTKFYRRKHLSQIWNTIFLHFSLIWPTLTERFREFLIYLILWVINTISLYLWCYLLAVALREFKKKSKLLS